MGWKISLKKPFGGSNSFFNRTLKNPIGALISPTGALINDYNRNFASKKSELERQMKAGEDATADQIAELGRLATTEEEKRQALGLKQQQQINQFANEQEAAGKTFRGTLAQSLADTGQQFFNRMNPGILEDLNSRGLFTSQTARDTEQANALKDIALSNENSLRNFDTEQFNNIQGIRGTALSALLGGDQSALDTALELKKAQIQQGFNEADAKREQAFAEMLAQRQSRNQLMQSLIGGGASIFSGLLAGRGSPSTPRTGYQPPLGNTRSIWDYQGAA